MSRHVDAVCERLEKAGALGKKLDARIDKAGSKRWYSKPGPELVRGAIRGDRRAYAEAHIVMHCVVAGERPSRAPCRSRPATATTGSSRR